MAALAKQNVNIRGPGVYRSLRQTGTRRSRTSAIARQVSPEQMQQQGAARADATRPHGMQGPRQRELR